MWVSGFKYRIFLGLGFLRYGHVSSRQTNKIPLLQSCFWALKMQSKRWNLFFQTCCWLAKTELTKNKGLFNCWTASKHARRSSTQRRARLQTLETDCSWSTEYPNGQPCLSRQQQHWQPRWPRWKQNTPILLTWEKSLARAIKCLKVIC